MKRFTVILNVSKILDCAVRQRLMKRFAEILNVSNNLSVCCVTGYHEKVHWNLEREQDLSLCCAAYESKTGTDESAKMLIRTEN